MPQLSNQRNVELFLPSDPPSVDVITTALGNISIAPSASAIVTPPSPDTLRQQTVKNIFKETLTILSSFSEGLPIPGVKGIIDTLIKLIRIVEATQANQEALKALNERCRRLIYTVVAVESSDESRTGGGISQELKQGIVDLNCGLLQILEDAKQYQDRRNKVVNAINRDDDSGAIQKINNEITGHVEHFFLRNTISNSVKLESIHDHLLSSSFTHFSTQTEFIAEIITSVVQAIAPAIFIGGNSFEEEGAFGCLDCDCQFSSIHGLQQHCHATSHDIGCKSCDRRFNSAEALEQHMRDSVAHNNHDSESEMEVDNSSEEEDEAEDEDAFECLDCDRQFGSIRALQQHCSATRHDIGCKSCGRYFKLAEDLEQHMRDSPAHNVHNDGSEMEVDNSSEEEDEDEDESTFECLDCDRQFGSIDALQQHCSATSHDIGCKPCNRLFDSAGALEQHIHNSSAHND